VIKKVIENMETSLLPDARLIYQVEPAASESPKERIRIATSKKNMIRSTDREGEGSWGL